MNNKELALKNIDLINNIIDKTKINKPSITKEDLFQQGFIGLIEAINTYDSEINIDFNHYASIYISFFINKLLINKNNKTLKILDKDTSIKNHIRVDSMTSFLRKLDTKKANVIMMYFGIGNTAFDINDIAFTNSISTSEIYHILNDGMLDLKYLIENYSIKKKRGYNYRREDSKYTYYGDYTRGDVDRATLLLTDEQRRIQNLRFNKETVNKMIKDKYKHKVHKRMLYYLDRLEIFASSKDAYVKLELEQKKKIKIM